MPTEVKLEMPVEQNGSKLGQDVNMNSDVPTPFHVVHEIEIFWVNKYQSYTMYQNYTSDKGDFRIKICQKSKTHQIGYKKDSFNL